jgi:hypothetical protein
MDVGVLGINLTNAFPATDLKKKRRAVAMPMHTPRINSSAPSLSRWLPFIRFRSVSVLH